MVVLMIGGCSTFMNSLIDKFNKNGHKVYLLTGKREDDPAYHKVFEKYNFPYDSGAVPEILESVRPDITVFMGAYDSNYNWQEGAQEAVRYTSGLMHILSSFDTLREKGNFFYLSSEEIFCESYGDDITEETEVFPSGYKAKAVAQGEEMCDNYRRVENLRTYILRFDNVYWIPQKGEKQNNPAYKMIMNALRSGRIYANSRHSFSMIFLNDAVEQAYTVMCEKTPRYDVYNLASGEVINETSLAQLIRSELAQEIEIVDNTGGAPNRVVFSNERFKDEFSVKIFNNVNAGVGKSVSHVKKHSSDFLKDSRSSAGKAGRKVLAALKIIVPYLENIACFFLFWWLAGIAANSDFFARLDLYLLYILLFAVVHGQQQAIFSGILSVLGFVITEMGSRTGFEVLIDFNTYVWMAQLFIVGLIVGYLRDRLGILRHEGESRAEYLHGQLHDIREINDSNVRIKQNYEAQVVNHKDSLGRIYSITAALEQYEPAEVLFYAAQAISNLMDCDDVAIYTVANADYARLFSATSKDARNLGNSINYSAMKNMYEDLMERRVYINRNMEDGVPSMAAPVFSENGLELILMLWDLPWDRMTLGEANRLMIVGAMIQNAIVRANRYMDVLRNQRYIEGTNILDADAFTELTKAFSNARSKGLADFALIEIDTRGEPYEQAEKKLLSEIRGTDYLGMLKDGKLYALLTNTNPESSGIIIERFKNAGYESRIAGR